MLELLIISACIKGSAIACQDGSIAYYKQSGIERLVSNKEQKFSGQYPIASAILAMTAAAAQGRAIINLGNGKALTYEAGSNTVLYRAGF